jgi:Matrixin
MMKFILAFMIISTSVHAYTLNNNFGASFKKSSINVSIDSASTCANANLTVFELEDIIKQAVKDFWNRVPTSNLRLKFGGFTGPHTNITTGRLCAPTDNACITSGDPIIAPVSEIVISCNDFATNFGGLSVLAVTIPNKFSGKSIKGAVILINDRVGTSFANLSHRDKVGVIAHEIGHAIGLGHTDDKAALMYYRTVNLRKALGEDDMLGATYLYPMHIDGFGLLGGCGTISTNDGTPPNNPPFWQMGATLGLMILIFEILKLLKRAKTRSAT